MQSSPTPPYWDLYAVHHAVDRESFVANMRGPDFDAVRAASDKALADIMDIEKSIEKYMDLPTTLIHGDLHYGEHSLLSCSATQKSGGAS